MLARLLAHLVHAWVVCIGTLLCGLGLIAMAFLALPLCVVLRFFPKAAADNEDLWYLHYGMFTIEQIRAAFARSLSPSSMRVPSLLRLQPHCARPICSTSWATSSIRLAGW